MSRRVPVAAALLALIAVPAAAVTVPERTDERSGAPVWKWRGDGVGVRAMARPPDQTQAFFTGRGFPDDAAKRFSRSCVLGMTLRNRSAGGAIRFNVARWGVRTDAGVRPLVATERWQERWREMGVSERARTAFGWATFPRSESLGEGGYLMGMVATGLDPGARFDLVVRWRQGEAEKRVVLEGLRCPRTPSPSEQEP